MIECPHVPHCFCRDEHCHLSIIPLQNSEFKPVKLRLKIDLVSYPAIAEGLVNMIIPLQITDTTVIQGAEGSEIHYITVILFEEG